MSSSSLSNSRKRAADQPSDLYDGILKVDEKLFYVLKGHLARHSNYFKNLFFENFNDRNKKIITLEDVSSDAFQIFLELCNGLNRLDDSNIEGATELSQMWQAELPLSHCLEFLNQKSKFSKREKFALAEKFNLEELKKTLFADVKTREHLDDILPGDTFANLKPHNWKLIGEKALEILEVSRGPKNVPDTPAIIVERNLRRLSSNEVVRNERRMAEEAHQLMYLHQLQHYIQNREQIFYEPPPNPAGPGRHHQDQAEPAPILEREDPMFFQ
ncbi:unnamed protein product [Caenorhabditis nigoni]